ncbi:hypothetical protein HELRODRAFT_171807 [Helobdella robusta]|uniref:Uncharacterized protein n=1 Tax=Helobdella robusta TaxID=6412 RepID=T1F4P8_HELRO|nr:hypothetical protein HELRODRAFT_171807 [Helobdella robusta]ESO05408.1 hypothetical protein HELRODRAFT_171807 [Helobdella robusta]
MSMQCSVVIQSNRGFQEIPEETCFVQLKKSFLTLNLSEAADEYDGVVDFANNVVGGCACCAGRRSGQRGSAYFQLNDHTYKVRKEMQSLYISTKQKEDADARSTIGRQA